MKEATYTSALSDAIEKNLGGKVLKISDRSTLGLPDLVHIKDGIVAYVETKILDKYEISDNVVYVQPWRVAEKDLRQYEVCRGISKHALVVYAAYIPAAEMSLVIPVTVLQDHFKKTPTNWLTSEIYLHTGKGLHQYRNFYYQYRRNIHAALNRTISS